MPAGMLLAAWSALPASRRREAAFAALVISVAGAVAYIGFGFAFQFGGIGLSQNAPPGLAGLDKAWSPFPVERWALAGLEGFFASGEGPAPGIAGVSALALHRLPMAIVAALIPVVALGDRVHRIALVAAGVVSTAIVFPIAGAWIWGGGWLAMLGLNLNLGHGAIDTFGSGVIFFASACVAWVALRTFGERTESSSDSPALPTAHQPLLALSGAAAFGVGAAAWTAGDPLFEPGTDVAAIQLLGGVAAAVVTTAYSWLATGRLHVLMLARGWMAGWIAAGASVWFIPPAAAIGIGAIAGALVIIAQYVIESKWRLADGAAAIAVCGAAGAWGMIGAGLFADGVFGAGWNGVAGARGVSGLLAADPGQLSAQVAALAAIGLWAILASAVVLFPFALMAHRPAASPLPEAALSNAPVSDG